MPPKRKAAGKAKAEKEEEPSVNEEVVAEEGESSNKRAKTGASTSTPISDGWVETDTVLVYTPKAGIKGNTKIIGFDIDDTIITTKSGKTFAQNSDDWVFWNDVVPAKLKEHQDKGFKIVFFSNQGGISKGQTTAKTFTSKLDKVLAKIPGVNIQIYASTEDGKSRKPAIGMWDLFVNSGNAGVVPDLTQSKYVGDAAGREKGWAAGKKKDFSDSDRKFAINLGIAFQTPEEFFLGEKPVPFVLHGADPKSITKEGPLFEPATAKIISDKQEVVVMVGYPGSGKSYFSVQELEKKGGYVRVNRDTLKTKEKCWKVAEEALDQKKSVVIDNTNPDEASRAPYIEMAKERKIPVRAFVMQTTFDEAMHMNQFREIVTDGASPHVPTMVYNMFRKNYKEPTLKEGFDAILKTYCRPKFSDPETEKLFYRWTPL